MIILGIDPGFERLGIAIVEKNKNFKKDRVLFSECFKTSSKLDFEQRLMGIGKEVRQVIKKWKPEILAIETLFLQKNQKTVMKVAEARGVVVYEAGLAGLDVFEASPPEIKLATTGYGKATKEQIIKMVGLLTERSPESLKKVSKKESDDELDAIAIAITCSSKIRF